MHPLRRSLWPKIGLLLLVAAAIVGGLWRAARQEMMRSRIAYHTEEARLHLDYERRLRELIPRLNVAVESGQIDGDAPDQAFKMVRSSWIASSDEEVRDWASRPPSPERTKIALKWANRAADLAAYEAACHDMWKLDYEQGRTAHHITNQEIKLPDVVDEQD